MTRRVINTPTPRDKVWWDERRGNYFTNISHNFGNDTALRNPYGTVGSKLWVRESTEKYSLPNILTGEPTNAEGGRYSADGEPVLNEHEFDFAWWYSRPKCPSIHMPRWASRITLEITGVRVERLRSITPRDVLAEGVELWTTTSDFSDKLTPVFRKLWESLHGAGSWGANPFVWVIEFRRLKP